MTIVYQNVFDVNYDNQTEQQAKTQAALTQIESTSEGQALFQRIHDMYGTQPSDRITLNIVTNGSSNYDEDTNTIRISFEQMTKTGYYGADGDLHGYTLQRLIVHEAFHAIDFVEVAGALVHVDDVPPLVRTTEESEGLAIQFANEFMHKYYGEERRTFVPAFLAASELNQMGGTVC